MDLSLQNAKIFIKDGMNFEIVAAQLQPYCDQLLAVQDGCQLYIMKPPYPKVVLEQISHRNAGTIFFFRQVSENKEENSCFAVFGWSWAKVFCPEIEVSEEWQCDFKQVPMLVTPEFDLLSIVETEELAKTEEPVETTSELKSI